MNLKLNYRWSNNESVGSTVIFSANTQKMDEERKTQIEKALEGIHRVLKSSEKYAKYLELVPKPLQRNNNHISDGEKIDEKDFKVNINKSIQYFNGKLYPYQIDGVIWMIRLFEHGINGILADEMGLGKTVQIIALISYLYQRGIKGPHLIVVPLSTLTNWCEEFEKFAPQIPITVFHCNKATVVQEFNLIRKLYKLNGQLVYPVVLTTYEMPVMHSKRLKRIQWNHLIVDEGHRIKNHKSLLSQILKQFQSKNRLLLTGTPLQNNLTELWSLFNFLLPNLFKNEEDFSTLLMLDDIRDEEAFLEHECESEVVSKIHRILEPFMLRRLKTDVNISIPPKKEISIYCRMSKFQNELYSYVLDKNLEKITNPFKSDSEIESNNGPLPKRRCRPDYKSPNTQLINKDKHSDYVSHITMQNVVDSLRKIADHPYLLHFPLIPGTKQLKIDADLIKASGKLSVLDTLLKELQRRGHKTLVFSNYVIALDLIEESLIMNNMQYARLDGGRNVQNRNENINEFNNNPDCSVFLISTRAGGLGLNLIGADTVVFFDRNWNPQVDLQAQSRCHRIGQTKPVVIYTLISKNTIDEKILERGIMKRRLEKVILQDGLFKNITKTPNRQLLHQHLIELRTLLNSQDNSEKFHTDGGLSRQEWMKILDRKNMKFDDDHNNNKENQQ